MLKFAPVNAAWIFVEPEELDAIAEQLARVVTGRPPRSRHDVACIPTAGVQC